MAVSVPAAGFLTTFLTFTFFFGFLLGAASVPVPSVFRASGASLASSRLAGSGSTPGGSAKPFLTVYAFLVASSAGDSGAV